MLLDSRGLLRRHNPFLFSVLAVAAMTLARWALTPFLGSTSPYITYVFAVAITGWYGGLWPALLAMFLCLIGANVFFIAGHWYDAFSSSERIARAAVFLVGSSCFAFLSEELLRTRNAAMRNEARLRVSESTTKKLLADIRVQNEKFYAVLQQMPIPVIVAEAPTGRVVFLNESAVRFWREPALPVASVFDEHHFRGFRLDGTPYHASEWPLARSVAHGEVVAGEEMTIVRNDGDHAHVRAASTVVRDTLGKVIAGVVVLEDLTEIHLAEHALRKAEKLAATGRLAATIAHEVNNPLAAVTNLLYLAQTDPGLSEPAKTYLTRAESELARVSHISRRALGFYRDNDTSRETRGDIAIQEVIAVYAPLAKNKGIELTCDAAPVMFLSTPGDLRQIVLNLIANAMDAVRPPGQISVRVRPDHLFGTITVQDTGTGIPDATLARIFDPFFTTKTDIGTGLGLWISKEIAEKHGGSIEVSTVPDEGSTFTVKLPLATSSVREARQVA